MNNRDHSTIHSTLVKLGSSNEVYHLSKNEIVELIKNLPIDLAIRCANQCIDPTTILGERIWKQEGLFACNLNSGTLKKIVELRDFLVRLKNVNYPKLGIIDEASYGIPLVDLRQHVENIHVESEYLQKHPKGIDADLACARRARAYFELGQFRKAIADYTRLTEIDPGLSAAYYGRARAYTALGNYPQVIEDCGRAIDRNASHYNAYSERAYARNKLGQYAEAFADANRAIQINPRNPFHYSNRACAYNGLGKYSEALADANYAINLEENYAEAYINRAHAYFSLRNYIAAVADCDRAIALRPDYSAFYAVRACVYLELKRYSEAFEDCNLAIEKDKNCADAYFVRADLCYRLHQYENAVRDFSEAIKLYTNPGKSYYGRACVYYVLGRYIEALGDCNKAIKLNPTPHAFLMRARVYNKLEYYAQAITDFSKAMQLNPSQFGEFRDEMRQCEDLHLSKYSHSIQYKSLNASIYFGRATECVKQKQYEQAMQYYVKAFELEPSLSNQLTKKEIFGLITNLPVQSAIHYANQCIDKTTVLGQRMWKQEGLFACNLKSGILKDIVEFKKLHSDSDAVDLLTDLKIKKSLQARANSNLHQNVNPPAKSIEMQPISASERRQPEISVVTQVTSAVVTTISGGSRKFYPLQPDTLHEDIAKSQYAATAVDESLSAARLVDRAQDGKTKKLFVEAVQDYVKALELDASQNQRISKNDIYHCIQNLPIDLAIHYANQCLDQKSVLGQRIWKQEGVFACNLSSGMLRKIFEFKNYLIWLRGIVYSSLNIKDESLYGLSLLKVREQAAEIYYETSYIAKNPNESFAYMKRGHAYGELKDYAKAISDYSRVIRLNKNEMQAYKNRAFMYFKLGKYNEAIADYTQAIKLGSNGSYVDRAFTYIKLEKHNEALDDCNQALTHMACSTTYVCRATAHNRLKNYAQAIEDCNKAVALRGQDFAEASAQRDYAFLKCEEARRLKEPSLSSATIVANPENIFVVPTEDSDAVLIKIEETFGLRSADKIHFVGQKQSYNEILAIFMSHKIVSSKEQKTLVVAEATTSEETPKKFPGLFDKDPIYVALNKQERPSVADVKADLNEQKNREQNSQSVAKRKSAVLSG